MNKEDRSDQWRQRPGEDLKSAERDELVKRHGFKAMDYTSKLAALVSLAISNVRNY
jgi:hypothetical protein